MKVLHLDSGRGMRGGQWQALRLHRGLHALGHESLLLARAGSPLLITGQQEGLPCAELRPLALSTLSRRFDLVHAHDSRSHTLGALFARAPLVVSRRVAFPVGDSLLSRRKYRRAALFLAVSNSVAEELRRAGTDNSRIAIVYDGVAIPQEPARGEGILIPQTDDPAKGMALALDAARLAGITPRLSQTLPADLPQAAGLLYITHSEGLGSGILLAMAHGLPVIASNVGGIPELIQDGVNGLLVPNRAEAIAAALNRLQDTTLCANLGRAARATVIARFSEASMVEATLAAYRRVHA